LDRCDNGSIGASGKMADLYRPGDHYVTCDRTGFKVRASQTQYEWTGARVRKESWEARHPQDFVRGKKDDMSADGHQPVPLITGPLTTAVASAAAAGATAIVVTEAARFGAGDSIGFPLRSGDMHRATVDSVASSTLTLTTAVPDDVLVGGTVINYSAVASPQYR
jgi:hypothetical protein